MQELIDRQAVRLLESDADAYTENWNDDYEKGFCDAINKVLELPTIEPEVRHGRWVYRDTVGGMKYYECTNCKNQGVETIANEEEIKWFDYCPRCGAKMDGGADNG